MTYTIVIVLIIFSALFSGLTLGLMSLGAPELKRKADLGDKAAKRVYSVRQNGNLLLTTLLVGNVAVNAALSIFLGSIASGFIAGIVATTLIVIFGEITPQAIFSRYALSLGSRFVGLVRIFIFVLYPICKPISMILDKVLGSELPTVYSKRELLKIIEEHKWESDSDVDAAEERIVRGALTFSNKNVEDVMTPRSVVKMFSAAQVINGALIDSLREGSYSRVPVYKGEQDNVVAILFVKDLIGKKWIDRTVGEAARNTVRFVNERECLDDVLDAFIETRQHLFIVRNDFGEMTGIITIEDILEEIIKREIVDEADTHEDMRRFAIEQNKS